LALKLLIKASGFKALKLCFRAFILILSKDLKGFGFDLKL
jgi:hypothetical protein